MPALRAFVRMNSAWHWRFKAAAYHLLFSALVVLAIAVLVFFVWFPHPLWKTSGGLGLFVLVVVCDLVLGPLFTLVISNPNKRRREWVLDLTVVAFIQIAALGYGVWTVWQARPIFIVFERDLYRVVRATDIPESLMPDIPAPYKNIPLWGPQYLSLRGFTGLGEQMETTAAEIEGLPMSAQPKFWIAYEPWSIKNGITGKPFAVFLTQFPEFRERAADIQSASGVSAEDLLFYPFVDKAAYWTIFVRKSDGQAVGFLPVDPYPD
jgi:hypothetical protein